MFRIVNGVSTVVQPGDTLWGCRYEVSYSGTKVISNLVPSLLTVGSDGKLVNAKGKVVLWCDLFTTDSLCWDRYRMSVANHLRTLATVIKNTAAVASKAISRCPSVTTSNRHKELVDAYHSAADTIK